MAEQQMRVLLIEDNPADARLIRELLVEAFGAALEIQTADRLSAGLDRLAQGGFDVVLLDLGLPDSQGIDTFVSLSAQAPETPVVVLTGLDDQMVAEQAARDGAQDYLLKGQGDSRSLRRALHYAMERKGAEEAVRRSEEQYRNLVENMSEVVYRVGIGPDPLQGPIQFVSDATTQILGYRPEEFYQDPGLWFRSIHPGDVAAVSATTEQMLLRREPCVRTYRLLPKEGREYRWFEDRVAPVFDSNGHIIALQGVARDVTESIEAAETLRLRTQEMGTLASIAGILAQPGALEERATRVLAQVVRAIQADHATLVVSDEEGQGLRLLTSVGISGKEPPLVTEAQLSQGLSGLVFQQGEPVLANDYASHPLALPELVAAGRRALIALPIRSGDRVLGVIAAGSEKTGHFTSEKVALLMAIADGMEALLENARLQEEERLHAQELEALTTIASILAQPGNLEQKATRVLEELVRVVRAFTAVLRVPDDQQGALRLVATAGDRGTPVGPLLPYGQGTMGLAFQQGEPVVVNDYASDPRAMAEVVEAGRKSNVALPIRAGGRTLGVITVASQEVNHFTPERVRLLTAIADGMGALLENARLQDEERLRTQELAGVNRDMENEISERRRAEDALLLRTREMGVLLNVGSILARTGSFEGKTTLVLQDLVQAVQADYAALSVPDEELHGLSVIATVGASGPTASVGPLVPYGQGIQGAAFERGETMVANDYASFPGAITGVVEAGRRSVVALPVRVSDRVLGVVAVSSQEVNHFTPERVRLLAAIADGMGALLENARLQEAERLQLEELATGNQQLQSEIGVRELAEEQLQQTLERMRQLLEGIVRAMASAVEMRDPYTAGHQMRVAQLALAISKRMGLTEDQQEAIRIAALLHDVGKIAVPSELLTKPGALSELEFAIIKTHPRVGYEMLETIEFPWDIATIASQHHERLDGSGYPFGLKDGEIELEARVLAVADVVEAMASHRPYRPALGIDAALAEIRQQRGILYDPAVADACLELFATGGFRLE